LNLDLAEFGEKAMDDAQKRQLELLAARFEEWMEAAGYSPKTRVNYARETRRLLAWLAENTTISTIADVLPAHLGQYQVSLYETQIEKGGKRRRLASGSQAACLAAARKFFTWLGRERLVAVNPASGLELPRKVNRLPTGILTPAEVRRMLDSIPTDRPRDLRDRAILETLYATGLRRAELLNLDLYDLNLDAGTLHVRLGKGGRDRVIPLVLSLKAILKRYLEKARPKLAKAGETHLFVSSRAGGGKLDPSDIARIVTKAARKAGIAKPLTPHALRHCCATHLLKGGADIRQIQKLLGHRRLSSTEIYTHVEVSDLAQVLDRCHPRGKPASRKK
jgi:integrase/recombinase XerD